jgi:hypothetical protein
MHAVVHKTHKSLHRSEQAVQPPLSIASCSAKAPVMRYDQGHAMHCRVAVVHSYAPADKVCNQSIHY